MTILLLVEDNPDLGRLVQRELQRAGYAVQWCETGRQALDCFAASPADLVILDWMLPDMDGMEVLRAMRSASGAPVIMLTARNGLIDRVVGLENGADDYLVKPFEPLELIARIHAQLRRTEHIRHMLLDDRQSGGDALVWRGLRLDPQAHQAWIDAQPLDLTRIEFDLLQLFMRNPGRTFNRIYLLETVWGQAYLEGDRAVDNTILRLRKKLACYGEGIETVRGIGYRLQAEGTPA